MPTLKCAAYFRMSTLKQEDSIERQRSQVLPYAARQGYQVVKEYADEGIGGDEILKRKGFQRMLRDAQAGLFEVIVCDDKDRFGRFDAIDLGEVVAPLRRKGVRLETVAQGKIDWTSFAGRLIDAILQESKKQETQATSRRVMTMMLNLAKQGKWLGGAPPYGYDLADDPLVGKRLVPGDPEKVQAVRLMFTLYGEKGYTLDQVVSELHRRGIKPPRAGKRSTKRHLASRSTHWDKTTVRAILGNRKYVGDLTWNAGHDGKYSRFRDGAVHTSDQRTPKSRNDMADWIVISNAHEPLVSRELFERVQARLAENRTRTAPASGKTAPKGGPFPLTGLLVCGHCGWRMIGTTWHGKRYYKCGRYHQSGNAACNSNTVMEPKVLRAIANKLQEVLLDPGNVRRLQEEVRRQEKEEAQTAPGLAARLRKQIGALERKIDQGMERIALIDQDLLVEYGAKVRGWKEERDRLRAELASAERPAAVPDLEGMVRAVGKKLERLREAVEQSDPLEAREALRDMVAKVELFFTQKPMKGKTRSLFKQGVIHVKTEEEGGNGGGGGGGIGLEPSDSLGGDRCGCRWCRSR